MKRNIIMGALVLTALFAFSIPASAARNRAGGRAAGHPGARPVNRGGHVAVSHVATRGGYHAGSVAAHRGGFRGGYRGGFRGGYRGYNRGFYGYRGYYPRYYGYGGYGYGYGAGYGLGLTSGLLLGSTLGGYNYGYYPNYGYGNYNYGYVPSYNYSDYNYGYVPNYSYSNYIPPTTTTYVDPIILTTPAAPATTTRDSLYYAPEVPTNTAHLRILVPASAKVWVGGHETEKTGTDREFDSPPLTPGKEYTYEIKARWMNAGAPVEQTRTVKVEANRTTTVDFGEVAEVAK